MAVYTIKATGGDYSTLTAWEAATPATLTEPYEAECYDFTCDDDVAISGITTSATNYIRIYAAASAALDGRSRDVSGVGFQLFRSSGAPVGILRIAVNHLRVEGIEITNKGTTGYALSAVTAMAAGANDVRVTGCIIHDVRTGTNYTCFINASNLNLTLTNNIIYGYQRTWDTRGAASVVSNNNTIWRHADQLGVVSQAELVCKNTYSGRASGSSECFWTGGSPPAGNDNASSDNSAATDYTASLTGIAGAVTFQSITPGAEDFRLVAGAALIDAGVTLTVANDIAGTTRPSGAAWDIGAWEFVSSGGSGVALQARGIVAGAARNGAGYSAAIRTQMRALSSARASHSLSTRIAARSRTSIAARARQSLGANLAARASSTGHGKNSTSLNVALAALSRAVSAAQSIIVGPGALAARATAMAGARAAASVSTALTGSAYTAARGFGAIVGPGSLSARAVARASSGASILASVAISATGHAASHSVSIFGAMLSVFARSSGGARGNASADLSTDLRARGAMQAKGVATSSGLIAITGRIFARLSAIASLAFPSTDALPGFIITAKARRVSITARKRITTLVSKFGGPMQQFDPKTPYARMLYAMDFVRYLNGGETLSPSSAIVEIEVMGGVDTNAASMLDGPPVVDGTQVKQWVRGGVDGCVYALGFKVITSSTANLEDKGLLPVTENI